MSDRSVRIITKQTAVPGRLPTGTTGVEVNFIKQGEMAQNTADKKLFGYDGANIFEFGSNSFVSLTGSTISGNLNVTGNLSGGALFSGSSDLNNIFLQSAAITGTTDYFAFFTGSKSISSSTLMYLDRANNRIGVNTNNPSSTFHVNGGLRFSSGVVGNSGSAANPTYAWSSNANMGFYFISGNHIGFSTNSIERGRLTTDGDFLLNSLSAVTFTASTIYSGNTNLYSVFQSIGANSVVSNGSNIVTGGTFYNQTISLVASPSVNAFIASGSSQLANVTATSISGGTVSGGTLYSGSTNLYAIFSPIGSGGAGTSTAVQAGSNITTGGTALVPIVSLVASPSVNAFIASGSSQLAAVTATSISGGTVSGGTLYSGTTNLNAIFHPAGANSVASAGSNIITGGTFFNTVVSLVASPSVNAFIASGSSQLAGVTATSISGGTVSGGTLYSGTTNLNAIFHPAGANSVVANGTNTTTGGTFFNTTINLAASPSVNAFIASGSSQLASVTATSVSGGTVSGGTLYSGSTNLNAIFHPAGANSAVSSGGPNITTGGTFFNTIISLAASPSVNAFIASGSSQLAAVTATSVSGGTVSGGTLYSGSTNLYAIFSPIGSGGVAGASTAVQPGSNITTGGTALVPIVSLTSSPSVNAFIASGSSQLASVTATSISGGTVSGGTIYSGSTDLYNIFATVAAANLYVPSTGTNSIKANNGTGNVASGTISFVGGSNSTASNTYSTVVNGVFNISSGSRGFIGNGAYNSATTAYSTVINGIRNFSSGSRSLIGSGRSCSASTFYSTVVNGYNNNASGNKSNILNGRFNTASSKYALIGNGYSNSASTSYYSTIHNGKINLASGLFSFIANGSSNSATATYSTIVNGKSNTASGVASAILGGTGHTITGRNSTILGGASISGVSNDTVYAPNARLAETTGSVIYSAGTNLYNIFATSSGVVSPTVVTVSTSTYTVSQTSGELILLCTTAANAITITLNTAVGNTCKISIKKTNSSTNNITATTTSSQTIDGGTTALIVKQYECITVISDNANWYII